MIDDRHTDSKIKAWMQAGPDRASAEFVERTLTPIPRMRQRRSWRIALGGRIGPLLPVVDHRDASTMGSMSSAASIAARRRRSA